MFFINSLEPLIIIGTDLLYDYKTHTINLKYKYV